MAAFIVLQLIFTSLMAFSFNPKLFFVSIVLLSSSVFCCKSEEEEYDPADITLKALVCFHDDYIYKSCDESYRLTESGNINISPEQTDEFCHGPCLEESYLVLKCLDNIFSHFLFFNKATTGAIKDTFKAGCSYTPERGHFDVAEHLQTDASKVIRPGYTSLLIVLGCFLVLGNYYW